MKSIKDISRDVHKIAVEKGWWDEDRNVGEMLMMVVTELAEAMEEYRSGNKLNVIYYSTFGKPEGFPIELADAIIRILDLTEKLEINIENAIEIKTMYNKHRPYRHGNKLA